MTPSTVVCTYITAQIDQNYFGSASINLGCGVVVATAPIKTQTRKVPYGCRGTPLVSASADWAFKNVYTSTRS